MLIPLLIWHYLKAMCFCQIKINLQVVKVLLILNFVDNTGNFQWLLAIAILDVFSCKL